LLQTMEEYRIMIDQVVLFLEGRADLVIRQVREQMDDAAAHLDFERAAELRDVLWKLETIEEPTVVMEVEGSDRDVIGYARDGDDAVVTVMRIRSGKLLGREQHMLENVEGETDGAVLEAYLARTYLTQGERAAELLVPFDFEDREVFETAIKGTQVYVPQRGPKRELVDLAEQNARHLLEELKLSSEETVERAGDPVYELQRQLGLTRVPRSLVCFDISHAQGTDTVAALVWFQNGRPNRSEYRKFKVKTVPGNDDFASMREVVTRYFTRRIDETKPLPDLVVIDGGKGQLSSAREAMEALGLAELPLISLAKRDEEIFVVGRSDPIRLPRRSPALRLLQQARDETHRFAITFQRKRRTMRTVTSELLKIPGIGPVKRRSLIHAFGSVQGVKDAGEEAIAQIPGFTRESARKLLIALGVDNTNTTATVASPVEPESPGLAVSDLTPTPTP
jgi:excinuclease ABC subunit C